MPPILRSRQVNPATPPSKSSTPRKSTSPKTPSAAHETSKAILIQSPLGLDSDMRGQGRRRSLPLTSNGCETSNATSSSRMISSEFGGATGKGLEDELVSVSHFKETKSETESETASERETLVQKKRKLDVQGGEFGAKDPLLSLRSGSRIQNKVSGGRGDCKGKEILIIDSDEDGDEIGDARASDTDSDSDSIGDVRVSDSDSDCVGRNILTRFSREEKGKGIMMDCDPLPNPDVSVDLDLKLGVNDDTDSNVEVQPDTDLRPDEEEAPLPGGGPNPGDALPIPNNPVSNMFVEQRVRQNKAIAKQNASRFARVSSMDLAENVAENGDVDSDAETEEVGREPADEQRSMEEDWPGPFSTAMKIVRDRENKANNNNGQPQRHLCVEKSTGTFRVIWKPNTDQDHQHKTRVAASLQDLSMQVLVDNSDAITSLKFVPDVLVHKLVSMLCDSRKMTRAILDLLFQGSPSEICISDCSWIEEEQFQKSIEPCNTGNLMVLQLDQCGRCMPDYVVLATLVHKGLPVLTTLSLKGACRLSDNGLKALISSAPALKSLNLSQCSLITETGVNAVADSLRLGLHELYLDDCQNLNMMLLLPALERLTNLEVLSLVGIPSVSNKFIKQLIKSIGRNIKELVLADCVNLTDSSLKAISKNCFQLCALDLINVTKLTDTGIGYLANCCQAIQMLKLSRNTFSDEAIAAFLEACGESLKELSLNNVSKVGPHTSVSIARRCKNLVDLDVSWCRSLTDECLGLIADSCESLQVLKVFGCTQITNRFCAGHSNQELLQIIGIKLTPILEHLKKRDLLRGPLRYSAVFPSDKETGGHIFTSSCSP